MTRRCEALRVGGSTPAGRVAALGSGHDAGMNLGRLLLVAFAALILSAPATAAVSADGQHGGVFANVSALAGAISDLG